MSAPDDDQLPVAEEEEFRPLPPQVAAQAPLPPRVTVVDRLYYQPGGDADPGEAVSTFDRVLTSGEQLYVRDTRAGQELKPVDCGWVGNNVAVLVVTNLEKPGGPAVRLAFGTGRPADTVVAVLIPPGESARFTPFAASRVWVGTEAGEAKYRVTAVPN